MSIGRRHFLSMIPAAAVLGFVSPAATAGAYEDFFLAVAIDDARSVKSLIARGLDPNIIEPERGDTGLILALREDAMRVFDVLLEAPNIDLEAKTRNGDNALMIACFKKNKRAVDALLAKGAEVNRPGWTPLHYAAAIGHNEIVQVLLDKSAYIDAESPNKTTPLMMAARGGHILTVKLLLDEGADATLRNDLGMNAIDFAARNDHRDIADGLTSRLRKAGKL
ncbi:MAG TPA: ankyrin repeat domain-containing protein [Noviherbaspirillum sp.]|nr:ankyrin repeat domain-containing protein [Noviherbaspirillum sp.]